MSKRTPKKAAALAVPTSRAEAEQLLQEIGDLDRQVSRIEADMNDRLSAIKSHFEGLSRPLNDSIDAKFRALHAWAEAHRKTLLTGRSKTAKLATGELCWRKTPPSVRITGVEAVMERLKQAGMADLLRAKQEINKEAILADPDRVDGIKGIKVSSREEFVAKPFESQLERAEPAKRWEAA